MPTENSLMNDTINQIELTLLKEEISIKDKIYLMNTYNDLYLLEKSRQNVN